MLTFFLQEDFKKKPKLATLLATLSNYDVTIPKGKAGKDGKAKTAKQQVCTLYFTNYKNSKLQRLF